MYRIAYINIELLAIKGKSMSRIRDIKHYIGF